MIEDWASLRVIEDWALELRHLLLFLDVQDSAAAAAAAGGGGGGSSPSPSPSPKSPTPSPSPSPSPSGGGGGGGGGAAAAAVSGLSIQTEGCFANFFSFMNVLGMCELLFRCILPLCILSMYTPRIYMSTTCTPVYVCVHVYNWVCMALVSMHIARVLPCPTPSSCNGPRIGLLQSFPSKNHVACPCVKKWSLFLRSTLSAGQN